jgi:hypothetical protein
MVGLDACPGASPTSRTVRARVATQRARSGGGARRLRELDRRSEQDHKNFETEMAALNAAASGDRATSWGPIPFGTADHVAPPSTPGARRKVTVLVCGRLSEW